MNIIFNAAPPYLTEEQLEEQFRQAMTLPVVPQEEQRLRGALQALISELLCRRIRQEPKLQSMLLACRLRLRALQNSTLSARTSEDCLFQRCELRELTEDLCAAADLLLHPLGRSIRFEAPEHIAEAMCVPRDVTWLVLELLCNAARHCTGSEIHVTMEYPSAAGAFAAQRKAGGKRPMALVLTVACEGHLNLKRLHAAGARQGSGASALIRCAQLHRGSLLWLEREGTSVAALRLALAPGRGAYYYDPPDYVELLCDQCSPVYTALAPVVGVQAVS